MVRIRDPLHGTVQVSKLEEKAIDSLPMQRLRGIRQLAMAYLVYPGANHTRFEHSIGTLSLAESICKELGLNEEKRQKVRLAALLHDIGHSAFSHEAEEVLKARIGTHEEIGRKMIVSGELKDIISQQFDAKEISEICNTPLGEIITSDIGADRMDYLLRDSHYTGVAYGVIDSDRLCSSLGFSEKGIVLQEGGLEAAESLLVARFTMFSTVYLHKTVRIASRMLQQAIVLALEGKDLDAKNATKMTDSEMLSLLCSSQKAKEYASRLRQRRLYKRAYSLSLEKLAMKKEEAEEELCKKCSCPVLVHVPSLSTETRTPVEIDGKRTGLTNASELVASLQKMHKSRLEALVICEEKNVAKVSDEAKRLFK